jgi:uncharacterized protein (DUF2236 family)
MSSIASTAGQMNNIVPTTSDSFREQYDRTMKQRRAKNTLMRFLAKLYQWPTPPITTLALEHVLPHSGKIVAVSFIP